MAEQQEWQSPSGSFDSPAAAAAWQQMVKTRRNLDQSTDLMLDLADIRPGSRVLDIAAGTGAQTLPAARRVGPAGSVLATDVAASMLAILADSAKEEGLANIETRVMDGGALNLPDESMDTVICRLGLMFLSDLDGALAGIRRVLRPGGRLSTIVMSIGDQSQLMMLPWVVLRRVGGLPSIYESPPVPWRLGAPGLLEERFHLAGFSDVVIRPTSYPSPSPSAAEFVQSLLARPPFQAELSRLGSDQRDQVLAEIEQTLRAHERPDGLMMTGEVLVVAGTK